MILDRKGKAQDLKTFPNEVNAEVELNRIEVSYKNLSDKFKCTKKDFTKQFAHIYAGRLSKSKDSLTQKCISKWGNIFTC